MKYLAEGIREVLQERGNCTLVRQMLTVCFEQTECSPPHQPKTPRVVLHAKTEKKPGQTTELEIVLLSSSFSPLKTI